MKMNSNATRPRSRKLRAWPAILLLALVVAVSLVAARAEAQPGTSRGVVMLPGNGTCSVAGTHDGTYYITTFNASQLTGCESTQLGIYVPPPTGAGPATLSSTKNVVDSVTGAPVTLAAVDWDASRNLLWGVHGADAGQAYLIDLGDKTMTGPATATLVFTYDTPGNEIELIDGLAWDPTDDTLWISPDVSFNVFHYSTTGTFLSSIQPKNQAGVADGVVSGVAIGAVHPVLGDTLYIGRNGLGEIRRVTKANGSFVSNFATANFRIEDLVCAVHPQLVGGPIEAILAKDAFGSSYEAFEVEPGTCPPPEPPCPPDDDDNGDDDGDDDGVDDDEESLFGNLLNDSDSDDDGINDGNDDGNGNGEDDEDEDDDDECPDDDDDDGDGEDDEDEDDDEDHDDD